ncbi:MAG: Hsp20/alpha crystallin family protein [Bacillota bacterium]|jgi:HSP20 family protein
MSNNENFFAARNSENSDAFSCCDPFHDGSLFERNYFINPFGFYNSGIEAFQTDIRDEGDAYLVETDLPGFRKDDIDVNLYGDRLSIRAERHAEREERGQSGKYLRRERVHGAYGRSFDVSGIDTEGIKALYDNGVLTVRLPKKSLPHPNAKKLDVE